MMTSLPILLRRASPALLSALSLPRPPLHLQGGRILAYLSSTASKGGGGESQSFTLKIPMHLIETQFTKSSGAGGQNVNKVNSKVEMRFKVADASWIPSEARTRLAETQKNRLNRDGYLVVESQRHRSQHQNRTDCEAKLRRIVEEALVPPKERNMWVGLGEKTKARYRDDKRKRTKVKANRKVNKRDLG